MDKQQINNNIDSQIAFNTVGMKWLRTFEKGDEAVRTYERLIDNRRYLKRIRYANNINPAAVVFGQSQEGKSYLIDNILSTKKGNCKVYDGSGTAYDFIDKINPVGGGIESTSLVSRFTLKKCWVDDRYPVKAVMLSPADIILTLCDSFYNDVQDRILKKEERTELEDRVRKKAQSIIARYQASPEVQHFIEEDDIYDVKEYLNYGFGERYLQKNGYLIEIITDTDYFKILADNIAKIPVGDWTNTFSILWNENELISETFRKLLTEFEKIDFNEEVYITMDAVQRVNGTLLDVQRIYELFELKKMEDGKEVEYAKEPSMSVLTKNSEVAISKSAFCALAAELIFKIDDELAEEKTFLNNIDFLDFPGARGRRSDDETKLTKSTCCYMLLRGKVAYLFNKYNSHYLISNLLFCHSDKQTEIAPTLSSLLKNWVETNVGKTPDQRAEYIRESEISPLFIVGTKFNMDLVKSSQDKGNKEERKQVLDHRWKKRFSNVLLSVIGENKDNKWFSEWVQTASGVKMFNDIYLLRSYDFSDRSGIFTGYLKFNGKDKVLNYNPDGSLVGEIDYADEYKEFLPDLKNSFVEYNFVHDHFSNPAKSWDEAVSVNKDGSAWIIENLTKAAVNTSHSRQNKFERHIADLYTVLDRNLVEKFFHNEKNDNNIKDALHKAGVLNIELDKLFGYDREFFSQFIQSLLIKESDVYDHILDTVNSMEVVDNTTFYQLFAIRNRAGIDSSKSIDENTEKLRACYNFDTVQELIDYLATINLTIEMIINPRMTKNFAAIICEVIEQMWFTKYLEEARFKSFIKRGLSRDRLLDLFENMQTLYRDKLHITDLIIARIRKYVANPSTTDNMAEMLADICAEMINRFVNEMGYSYYNEETWKKVEEAKAKNNLQDLCLDRSYLSVEKSLDSASIAEVFDVLENLDKVIGQVNVPQEKTKNLPDYSSYTRWTELMKISFVARCDIPDYNEEANNELRTIIEKYDPTNKNLK